MRRSVTDDSRQARIVGESHSLYGGLCGEKDERVLPEWLNAARGTASYKRVIRILELIRQTEERFRDARARHAFVLVSSDARKGRREKLQLQRAADRPHSDLARALKRYGFRIRLTMPSMDVHWLFNMYCLRRADDFCWETQYGFRVFEGDAVMATSRLAERGLLSRVRVCATCSQWLFARHSNYKFCNSRCRERYYTSTDEYRARKAGHMRQYRERLRRRVETERANLLTWGVAAIQFTTSFVWHPVRHRAWFYKTPREGPHQRSSSIYAPVESRSRAFLFGRAHEAALVWQPDSAWLVAEGNRRRPEFLAGPLGAGERVVWLGLWRKGQRRGKESFWPL